MVTLGERDDQDDDHDHGHAHGDEHAGRNRKAAGGRDFLIAALDKGLEPPGIRARILKLRHADDCSWSAGPGGIERT